MENKVKFYLHSPNAMRPTPIMMVCNYGYKIMKNGKKQYLRLKLAVGWSIHPKDWSSDFQRVLPASRNSDKVQINADLGTIEGKVVDSLQFFKFQGIIPSVSQLRNHIMRGEPIQLFDVNTPVVSYIEKYVVDCGFKKNTIQNHQRLINGLRKYQDHTKSELYFETMDATVFRAFFKFIGKQPTKYRKEIWSTHTMNSIADFKKNLRKFFNMAKLGGIKVHRDFSMREFTPSYYTSDSVYLSLDRIQQLVNFDLSAAGRPNLELTKVQLLIGCYTGLRNSDWGRLGAIIDNGTSVPYVQVRTRKSRYKTVISLPVYKPLLSIYQKYGNKFPESQSNQKFNESVKELGKLLGWNEIVKVNITRVYDENEDRIKEYPFYQLLSSHTGRRSFATNSFKAGVNPQFIMQFTGHKKLTDFFNYIKLSSSDNIEQFYEQTKDLFEPKAISQLEEGLIEPASEALQSLEIESKEMLQLHSSRNTSARPVSSGNSSTNHLSRTG